MEDKKQMRRDGGGYVDIGTEEDGAILDMPTIGDRLIVIKEGSIYEMLSADKIDPKRTNPSLPAFIPKLIINKGIDSELVGCTLLTTKTLFKQEYFESKHNCDKIQTLSLELLEEFAILENEINEYLELQNKAVKEYEDLKAQKKPQHVPTIINLETRCKTIFQKADHIQQILIEISSEFYKLSKQSHFPMLHKTLEDMYGKDDPFTKFIEAILDFSKIIRNLRNGLDHRLASVKVVNFDIQPDSNIISPTIELNSKEAKLPRTALSSFLPIVIENFITISEQLFAYIAGKNTKPTGMPRVVKEIPEAKRRYKNMKFCFWLPLGEGGYFDQ